MPQARRSPPHRWIARRLAACACWAVLVSAGVDAARAGGGPENLFLVVNQRSWSSLSIANHYIHLRNIPACNVFYVDWTDDNERVEADVLRRKLLLPVIAEIRRRGIADHIDYVAYSSDFPWRIDCSADPTVEKMPPVMGPNASLTGVTYFHEWFLNRRPDLRHFRANGYYRPIAGDEPPPSQGFHSWYGWNEEGRLLEAGGVGYLLSAMLGVTSGRGNSTAEVVSALTDSAGADYTKPAGTIYFAKNNDVRSTTRHDLFPGAVAAIKQAGAAAEIVDAVVPADKTDVVGLMLGTAEFSLKQAHTKLRPGAICEHLTSHGAELFETAGQTPISAFVRAGAALTSGSVVEPFAVPFKFPSPYMHLHYVRGCSAAEAFYEATNGPYQMLVVGDPLCRPWARRVHAAVAGIDAGQTVRGVVRFAASAEFEGGGFLTRMELFVDGLLHSFTQPGGTFTLDTRALPDGHHELRIMAAGGEPIEMRGGVSLPIVVANHEHQVTLTAAGKPPYRWFQPIVLKVKADDALQASGIIVAQGTRRIGQVAGSAGELTIEPRDLGVGPVKLQAFALSPTGGAGDAVSDPLDFYIEPSEPLKGYALDGGLQPSAGVLLAVEDGPTSVVEAPFFTAVLTDAQIAPGKTFHLQGLFRVDEDGVYQFHARHALELALFVNDRPIYSAKNEQTTLDYVPISLAAGLHKLDLRGKASAEPTLDLRFGLRGVQRLSPAAMSHIPPPKN